MIRHAAAEELWGGSSNDWNLVNLSVRELRGIARLWGFSTSDLAQGKKKLLELLRTRIQQYTEEVS